MPDFNGFLQRLHFIANKDKQFMAGLQGKKQDSRTKNQEKNDRRPRKENVEC
jgi:hypothetical protein